MDPVVVPESDPIQRAFPGSDLERRTRELSSPIVLPGTTTSPSNNAVNLVSATYPPAHQALPPVVSA